MIIIGERINASRKSVAEAIFKKDAGFIGNEALVQARAGADFIEVNAGLSGENEAEDLEWLVRTVQATVDRPLCVDTTSAAAAARALAKHRGKAILNSLTAETQRFNDFLALAKQFGCGVVGLCMDEKGIPGAAEERRAIAGGLIDGLTRSGIPVSDIYIDPLVYPISVAPGAALVALDTIRLVRRDNPEVHITGGLSNVSFGLPGRKWLNQAFLIMALREGMDAPIVDPGDDVTGKALCSARALLAQDEYCLQYIGHFRRARGG